MPSLRYSNVFNCLSLYYKPETYCNFLYQFVCLLIYLACKVGWRKSLKLCCKQCHCCWITCQILHQGCVGFGQWFCSYLIGLHITYFLHHQQSCSLKEKDSSLGIHLAITSQQVEELSWTSIAPPKFAWLFSQCRVAWGKIEKVVLINRYLCVKWGSTNTSWHMGIWERDIYGLMGRAIIT